MGDATSGPVRLSFNPQLRIEFRGATVTSDAGLLLPRELDERLGLDTLIERHLTDPRTGRNRQFPLADLFRQSIYSRLAEDPTFRMLASRERRETSVALTSTLHWFETEVLAEERNYQGLGRLNTALIQHASTRSPNGRVTLDIDSSESPVHGAQEQSAYNGHFESVCYHPLFVFNPEGDCLAAKLRPAEPCPAGPIPQLPVSGGVLEPAATRDREDRASSRGTLSSGGLHCHHLDGDEPGCRPLLQPARDGRAVDQGGQGRHPLDPALLPSVAGQRSALAPRGHRLQSRQSAASARPAGRHPELVSHEPPAADLQDRRTPHPTCAVLHPAAGGEPFDADSFSADYRAHRATRMAPHVIEKAGHEGRGKRSALGGSVSGPYGRRGHTFGRWAVSLPGAAGTARVTHSERQNGSSGTSRRPLRNARERELASESQNPADIPTRSHVQHGDRAGRNDRT